MFKIKCSAWWVNAVQRAASWWAWFSGRAKNAVTYIFPFPLIKLNSLTVYAADQMQFKLI